MPTNEDALIRDYVAVADDVFAAVKPAFSPETEARLAAKFTLPEGLYADLKEACHAYVSRTLAEHGITGDHDDPYLNLRDHNQEITNLTINGALIPRIELEPEFNEIQRRLAGILEHYDAGSVFDWGQCPANLRFSIRSRLDRLAASHHPYKALQPHSDVWAGEPIDFINFFIPIYIDGAALNLDLLAATPDTEFNTLRAFDSYEEALETVEFGETYGFAPGLGEGMIVDARLIHNSAYENLGTIRASFDFRFRPRMENEPALKRRLDAAETAQNVTYVPYDRWRQIGTSVTFRADQSFDEARKADSLPPAGWYNHRFAAEHRAILEPSAGVA